MSCPVVEQTNALSRVRTRVVLQRTRGLSQAFGKRRMHSWPWTPTDAGSGRHFWQSGNLPMRSNPSNESFRASHRIYQWVRRACEDSFRRSRDLTAILMLQSIYLVHTQLLVFKQAMRNLKSTCLPAFSCSTISSIANGSRTCNFLP